jgi:hypothetical protein
MTLNAASQLTAIRAPLLVVHGTQRLVEQRALVRWLELELDSITMAGLRDGPYSSGFIKAHVKRIVQITGAHI